MAEIITIFQAGYDLLFNALAIPVILGIYLSLILNGMIKPGFWTGTILLIGIGYISIKLGLAQTVIKEVIL